MDIREGKVKKGGQNGPPTRERPGDPVGQGGGGSGQMKRCAERHCTSFAPPGYAFCGLHNMREPAEAKGTPIDDCAVCEETPCRGWPECAEERSEQYMARKREREEAFKSSLSLSEARELWVQWKRVTATQRGLPSRTWSASEPPTETPGSGRCSGSMRC